MLGPTLFQSITQISGNSFIFSHLRGSSLLAQVMDGQYRQESMGSASQELYTRPNSNDDEAMGGVDDNRSATPTGGYSNGQQIRPQNNQLAELQPSNGTFSPPQESDRYSSPNMTYQQQPMQPVSRPSSGLSGAGDRYGSYSQTYQEQNQRPSHQPSEAAKTQSSVVIKVGMVGDAQIGKTSLMVKYVEGSWDEDYIQTLGGVFIEARDNLAVADISNRCKLHGENNLNTEHRNHVFDMGSRRPTRVREYASACMQ